jgi:hypothetical protein
MYGLGMIVLSKVFPGGGDILLQEGKGQVEATLQQHSLPQVQGPASKQHICQSINRTMHWKGVFVFQYPFSLFCALLSSKEAPAFS